MVWPLGLCTCSSCPATTPGGTVTRVCTCGETSGRVIAFVRCIESQRDAIRCVSRGSLHTCGGGGGEATAVAVATGIGAIGIVGEGMGTAEAIGIVGEGMGTAEAIGIGAEAIGEGTGTAEAIGIGAEAIGAAEATGVAEAKNASLAFALCGTAPPRWCQ
jgi:hypothetical protein